MIKKADQLSDAIKRFSDGTSTDAYQFMGCHPATVDGQDGYVFRVWAPHAKSVRVLGRFNDWDKASPAMERISPAVWERFIPGVQTYDEYKYYIERPDGTFVFRADPYGTHSATRPDNASKVFDLNGFQWTDAAYRRAKAKKDVLRSPVNIYEMHLGSWRRHEDGNFLSYVDCANQLIPYLKDMGYTHVELLPISEFPYDPSWGYQVTGYYAPTSRYGTPEDFRYFIDYMHRKGIGVILDWVPAHFPRDAHGLADFDGCPLYEYADPKKGEHPDWGTKIFDYEKHEVSNFLIANALYWVEKFHVDGLRVDAVASMLYLDYGKQDGQWIANKYGGHENLEAIEFFKHLNSIMKQRNPGSMIIAEESTAWPKVTEPPEYDGLGFTFKWNMGWMHDFLEYMKLDPFFRKANHSKMTFGMTYACSENFILVLSHDEVVHLKCSMLNKMPGYHPDKFANLKVGYTFMMGHPGKKLLFMGQEFGQLREWSEERELDWFLLKEPLHEDLKNYFRDLLHLYRKFPALYSKDYDWTGFEWINCDDADRSIFSFVRKGYTGRNNLLFVCNFTPVERPDYRVGVPKKGKYTLLLDSKHGLLDKKEQVVFTSTKKECDGRDYSFSYPLPAYGAAVFKY